MKLSEHITSQITKFKEPYSFGLDGETSELINRYKIIKQIYSYKRDKFVECTDERAIFWNIAKENIPHFKKNILPSIKDFYPEGRGNYNQFQAWVTKVRFRKWARESGFIFDLNELADNLTEFGEAVWKVCGREDDKDVKTCDLRRIYFDRTCDFKYSDKIEIHEMSEAELREKEGIWKDIDSIIADKGDKDKKFKIYEYEGWYKDDKKKKPEKIHAFVYGEGDNEVIAFEEKLKKDKTKYYYFKLNDELIGVYERLFGLQELANRRVNQNDEAQSIASLLLLKSENANSTGNALRDAVSGDIVNDPSLQQVGIDNRGLTGFLQEMVLIHQHAQSLCMTPEVIRGDDMPSGTPFRSIATLTNKAANAFKPIRTQVAEKIIEVLVGEIYPYVVKGWENDYLDIADNDNDIREYDKRVTKFALTNWIKQQFETSKKIPTEQEIEIKKQEIAEAIEENGRRMFIAKGFFNWDFGFIYNPANEVEDRAQQNDVINNLIQYKMANPNIANDPLFRQLAEKNGVSAVKLSQEEIQQLTPAKENVPNIAPKKDKLMAQVDSNG